jgi:hypothetical protein
MSMPSKLPLKMFWDAVEQRLAACSAAELRAILQTLARETLPSERRTFLGKLTPPLLESSFATVIQQDVLLADIDDLVQELRNDMANPETGREPWESWDEEDPLGPYAPFVGPFGVLFDRTDAAFDEGQPALAREAYRRLFAVLQLEDDYGRGIRVRHLEGEVDLDAARARYLRAVYETETPDRRPEVLYAALLDFRTLGGTVPPMLGDLIAIAPRPLPEYERFLADWRQWVGAAEGWEADAWLREALRLAQGTSGLAELARQEGLRRPRAYLDWFGALATDGQFEPIVEAAQEALAALPDGLAIRAAVADCLAEAAQRLNRPEVVMAGRWQAFQAKPTLARLLTLWETAPLPERPRWMATAAAHLRDSLSHPPAFDGLLEHPADDLETPARASESALAHACLLGGDWEAAYDLSAGKKVLGWSNLSNPQGLVVTSFLVYLSGTGPAVLPVNLHRIWQWELQDSIGFGPWREGVPTADDHLLERLERSYRDGFATIHLPVERQQRLLDWCLDVAGRRVDAIIEGQHRNSYAKAAVLIGACSEVLHLRGHGQDARGWLADMRNRYPRHRAFLRELSAAEERGATAPARIGA